MVRGGFHPVASGFGLTDGAAEGHGHLGKTCSQSDLTLATEIETHLLDVSHSAKGG